MALLESVNMSIFNWLFKIVNVLMKYTSIIFLWNENLGTKNKIDHDSKLMIIIII